MPAPITHGISLSRAGAMFEFPVNPRVISIQRARDAHTVDIVNFREVARLGNRKLRRIEFDSFLPYTYDESFCHYTPIPLPNDVVAQVEHWMSVGDPTFLSISGTPVGMWVIVTTFDTEYRDGHPRDIFFSFQAIEWVDLRVDVSDPEPWPIVNRPPDPERSSTPGTEYVVVSGDTLSKISKKFYGTTSRWPDIHEANRSVIGSNPNLIQVGMVLVIPA